MIRLDDKIRLTQTEQAVFETLAVDHSKGPTTVEENNRRMAKAAEVWAGAGTAEGDLLASLAQDQIIPA